MILRLPAEIDENMKKKNMDKSVEEDIFDVEDKRSRASSAKSRIKGPKEFHRILDHRMILPIIVIIAVLVISIAIYSYIKSDGEVYIEASAGATPPSSAYVSGDTGTSGSAGAGQPTYCKEFVRAGAHPSEDACFAGLAVKNGNPDYCYGISDPASEDMCFLDMAKRRNDKDSCLELEGEDIVTACLNSLAEEYLNIQACWDIPIKDGPDSEYACIFKIAMADEDPAVCDLLFKKPEPYSMENCLEALEGG